MDFIVSNILMPLGALGTTLVVGQLLDKEALKKVSVATSSNSLRHGIFN